MPGARAAPGWLGLLDEVLHSLSQAVPCLRQTAWRPRSTRLLGMLDEVLHSMPKRHAAAWQTLRTMTVPTVRRGRLPGPPPGCGPRPARVWGRGRGPRALRPGPPRGPAPAPAAAPAEGEGAAAASGRAGGEAGREPEGEGEVAWDAEDLRLLGLDGDAAAEFADADGLELAAELAGDEALRGADLLEAGASARRRAEGTGTGTDAAALRRTRGSRWGSSPGRTARAGRCG